MKRGLAAVFSSGCLALALSGMGSLKAEDQPEPKSPLQKSPIALPTDALLPATFSVSKWYEIPVIQVSINTSLVERIGLDTGLNANVVIPESAARLALSPLNTKTHLNVLNLECEAQESQIQKLRARTLELKNVSVALADLPAMLSQHPHPDAPAVWFGTPFLSAFQVTFDPGSSSITLDKPDAPFPRNKETAVTAIVMRDGRPFVKVSIPGAKPFLALIDTGSPGTVIPTEIGEKLKLKPVKSDLSAGKQGKAALVELSKMTVGKAEWKGGRVHFITADPAKEFDKSFAVLGMDFLSRFKVSLNYTRLQIALTPPTKAADTGDASPAESKTPP